jgi:hypothetical protein
VAAFKRPTFGSSHAARANAFIKEERQQPVQFLEAIAHAAQSNLGVNAGPIR